MHVKRTANRAAHACAHFAASSAFEFWANDAPSFLLQILQDDCNHANEWMKKLFSKKNISRVNHA